MGHTNSTANIALPQFIGTDKPTWLGDVNGAFSAIDSKVGTIDADIAATDAKADTAISDAAAAVTTATNANNTAGTASTTATQANNIANNALTVANNADGHTNQLELKVGLLADLTTTDKTSIVNAINEVNGAIGTPSASQVSYDNTGSGLTATNVQDAIDEVAQGGGGSGVTTVSVTADGVKTYSQLLDDLYALISSASIHMGSLHILKKYIPVTAIDTGIVRCAGFNQMSTSSLDMYIANLQASSSSWKNIYGLGTLTENDISSQVPTSGEVIEFSYI